MVSVGLLVPLHAKPGKEDDVAKFLEGGQALVEDEPDTVAWFAIRLGPSEFAIFDVFEDESGRQAHLSGKVAEALMAQAPDLFAQPPEIRQADVIASKLPE
ncbi:MAG: antibiotic biosynthesis monooxygenase [Actinomycetota bacterium]|nr:antibiotic biosynthesis monooxygenase [Actinomycetota bacterium]